MKGNIKLTWKEQSWYLVMVSFTSTNPLHEMLLYTGFLEEDGDPGGCSKLVSNTEDDPRSINEAYEIIQIKLLHEMNKKEKPLATLIKKDSFRSKPDVNMSEDMYRLSIDISKRNFLKFSQYLEERKDAKDI